MNNFETANKVSKAIHSLSGLCFDDNGYEYLTAIIAVCKAIEVSYPRHWVVDCCGDGADHRQFVLSESEKELLDAHHEAWREGCPIADKYYASGWAERIRPDLYLKCFGEVVDG